MDYNTYYSFNKYCFTFIINVYYFSLSSKPLITVNVIGHQWYWTYETYYRYNDINDIMNLDNVLTKHVDALKLGYWLVNFFQDILMLLFLF